MRSSSRLAAVLGVAAGVCLGSGVLVAQEAEKTGDAAGGDQTRQRQHGNWDPAQMQQRMMDSVKERLGFTDDAEWAAVMPLVQKVMDARRESIMAGMRGFGHGGRRGGPGGENAGQGGQGGDQAAQRGPGGQTNPEADALQKAITDNAPAAQIKEAMEKYRAAAKERAAKLTEAQENLRKVLTAKQEAQALLMGLIS